MTVGLASTPNTPSRFLWGNSNVFTDKKLEDMSDGEYRDYLDKTARQRDRESQLISITQNRGLAQGQSVNPGVGSSGVGSSGSFNWQSGTFGDLTKQAKDLAEFNLGLNQRQADFDFEKRNKEFDNNTARQQRINEQQNTWQSALNRETQDAQTKRLDMQIQGQNRQQDVANQQQNFMTGNAVRLASRRLGAR
jgi:hypothetical protein